MFRTLRQSNEESPVVRVNPEAHSALKNRYIAESSYSLDGCRALMRTKEQDRAGYGDMATKMFRCLIGAPTVQLELSEKMSWAGLLTMAKSYQDTDLATTTLSAEEKQLIQALLNYCKTSDEILLLREAITAKEKYDATLVCPYALLL